MISFRPKLGTERNSEWRCCFCLHVRTGTILLGSWHLLLHLLALGLLAAIVRDPQLLDELERNSPTAGGDWNIVAPAMPTPVANVEARPSPVAEYASQPRDHTLVYNEVDMGALVTVCILAITVMLIWGAATGRAAHLLPFFCLQIFDFAITVLTATGYLCYPRSIHHLVSEARRVPWRDELLSLPPPALAFFVLFTFLVGILLKGYWISVVWRCYKYLTMRTHSLQSLSPYVISRSDDLVTAPYSSAGSVAVPAYTPPTQDYSNLLPDYEEAVKQTPPPSYRAATLMADADPKTVNTESTPAQPAAAAQPAAQPAAQQPPTATNTIVMLPQGGDQARV